MEKDVVKVLLSTVTAVTILNILTHGDASTKIANAVFGGWANILGVLGGQPSRAR